MAGVYVESVLRTGRHRRAGRRVGHRRLGWATIRAVSDQLSPPPPPPAGYPPLPGAPGYPPPEDTTWAVLVHLSYVIASALPIAFVFGPLIVMLVAGPQRPFTRANAVEALNFQLTVLIALIVSIPLMFVIVGFFTAIGVAIVGLVFSILAAVAASRREVYRYPLTIRMVR